MRGGLDFAVHHASYDRVESRWERGPLVVTGASKARVCK